MLRTLRQEVGFHCPVFLTPEVPCGCPYLTWHHFDPPWRDEQHHRPEGMIALCRMHADAADSGAYTDDQLRRMKDEGVGRGRLVSGRFEWMRQEFLAVVGGNAYHETPVPVQIGGRPAVWFGRNPQDELLLNFVMPTLTEAPRASIEDSVWVVPPDGVSDLVCPPSGRLLKVDYANGDRFQVEFRTVQSRAELDARVPQVDFRDFRFNYPLTTVRIWERAAGSFLRLGPTETQIGRNPFRGGFTSRCGIGLALGPIEPYPSEIQKVWDVGVRLGLDRPTWGEAAIRRNKLP